MLRLGSKKELNFSLVIIHFGGTLPTKDFTRDSMYAVGFGQSAIGNMSSGHQFDLRNSLRFPFHLQVTLRTATDEYQAKTIDISGGGILFHTEAAIQVDSPVQFTIEMPVETSGTEILVLVKCQGRVVRCSEDASGRSVAVAIDEYEFQRL